MPQSRPAIHKFCERTSGEKLVSISHAPYNRFEYATSNATVRSAKSLLTQHSYIVHCRGILGLQIPRILAHAVWTLPKAWVQGYPCTQHTAWREKARSFIASGITAACTHTGRGRTPHSQSSHSPCISSPRYLTRTHGTATGDMHSTHTSVSQ